MYFGVSVKLSVYYLPVDDWHFFGSKNVYGLCLNVKSNRYTCKNHKEIVKGSHKNASAILTWFPLCLVMHYLFPAHVNKQLCAIRTESNIGGNQDPQAVIVVREFHRQVT